MGRLTRRAEADGVKAVWYGKRDVFLEGEVGYVEADKLAHYEDMEEQGRLITLPCAVGDTVWCTDREDDGKGAVTCTIHSEPFACLVKDLWGIKFFATKEEAEAKLKELEG